MLISSNTVWSQEKTKPVDSTHTTSIKDIRTAGQIFAEHKKFLSIIIENEITINSLQETVQLLQKDKSDAKQLLASTVALSDICSKEKLAEAEKHKIELKQVKRSKTSITIIAVVTTLTTIALLVK